MGSTTTINKSGTYLIIGVPITITNPPPSGILINITAGCVLVDLGNECIDANDLVNTVFNINNQSNIVIRNGTIINASQNAIFINNSNNVLLQNLTIENTTGGDSIVIENSTDITLDNVTILNNNKNGFTFQNDTDVSLINSSVIINTATVTNQIGVNVVNTNNLFIDDVKVINNFNGFQFSNSTNIVVDNSIAEKNTNYGYLFMNGSQNIIFNNDIAINNTVGGFYFNAIDIIIKNSTSISNGTYGFYFDQLVNNLIMDVSISAFNEIGIFIDEFAQFIQMINSIINDNSMRDIEDNSTSSNITNVNINTVQHMFSSNVVTTFNQNDFNITGQIITVPGTYIIEQDITSIVGGFAITIESNDVILDLGGQTINGGDISGGIVVNNVSNVTIRNGNITNTADNSIQINNCSGTVINNINTDGITTINTNSIEINNSTSTVIENTNVNNNSGGSGYSISNSSDTTIQNSSGCGSSSSSSSFPFGIISSVLSDATSILDSVLCSKPSFPFPEIGIAAEGGAGLIVNNVQIFNAAGGVVVEGVAGVVISNVVATGIGAVGGIVAGAGAVDVVVINSIINGAAGAAFYTNILNTIFNNCTAINSTVAGFSIDAGAIGAILKLCTAMNNDIGLLINATAENVEVVDSTINNNISVDIEDNSTSSNITNVNINTVQHMFSSNVVTTFNQSNFNVAGVTITVPGTYIIEQDITSVSSGFVITIESNDVILDLGGQTINGGAISGGIVVNNVSNVTIRNGNIINTSDNSIQINNCSGTVINNINTDGITTINTTSIAINNSTSTVIENTNVNNNSGGSGYSISNSSDTTIQNSSGCGSSSSSSSFPFGIISSVLSDATSILDSVLCSKPSFPFPEIGIAAEGGAGLIVNNVQIFNAAGGVVVEGVAGVVISNVVGTGIGAVGGIVAGAGAVDVVVINSIINGAAGAAFYTNILNTIFNNCIAINSTVAGFSIDAGAIGAILKLCTAMNNEIGLLINATAENVEVVDSTINNNTSVDIEDNSTSSNITNVNINTVQHMFSSNVVTTFNQSNFNVTGVTITVPGTYIVEQDITSVASGFVITIESNDVILDLGGQTINGGAISGGIVVNNVSNVTIRNGNIINTSDNSIQINNCSGTVINNINTDGITTINTTSIAINNSTSTVIENTNVNNNSGGSGYSISNSSDTTIQNSSGCGSSSSSSSFPFGIISSVLSDATSILDSVLCSKPSFPFPEIGIAAEGGAGLIVNNVQIFNAAGGVVVEGVAGVVISNVVGTGIGAVGGIVAGAGAVDVVVINSIINGAAGAAFYTNILNTIFNNCIAINSTVAGFLIDAGAIGAILKLCTAMNNDIGLLINATAENVEVVDSTINNNTSVDIEDNSTSSNITNVNINTVQHMFSSNVVTTFNQSNFNVTGVTITVPGTYIVEQDITSVASGFVITIESNDVILDLGGQTINGGAISGGIVVNNVSNVTIRNGNIINTSDNSIQINNCSGTVINNINTDGITTINTTSIAVNNSTSTVIENTNVNNNSGGSGYSISNSSDTTIQNSSGCGSSSSSSSFPFGIISSVLSDATSILDSVLCSKPSFPFPEIGIAAEGGAGLIVNNVQIFNAAGGVVVEGVAGVVISNVVGTGIGAVGGIVAGAGAVDVVVINSIINGAAGAAFYTNILNTIFNNCTAINSTVAGFSIDAGAIGVILKLCTAMNNDIGLLINATAENVEVVDSTINNNISVDIEDNSTSSNITNVNINTVQHMFSSNVVTTFDQTNFNVAGQTIIAPGTYILEQDVIFSAGGFAITIDSDDVTLDLGGQTIDCDGTGGGVMVTDQSNVTIRHGSIVNTGTNAIQVNDGSNTLIDDITISGMMALNTDSIQINGSDETTIQNTNVDNENAGPAVAVNDSQNTNIENIVARGDIGGGVGGGGIVSVDTSEATRLLDSTMMELGIAHSLIGVTMQLGNGIQVVDCGMISTASGILMNNMNNVNIARNLLK